MTLFICSRCNREFKRKYNLQRHLEKKNKCKEIFNKKQQKTAKEQQKATKEQQKAENEQQKAENEQQKATKEQQKAENEQQETENEQQESAVFTSNADNFEFEFECEYCFRNFGHKHHLKRHYVVCKKKKEYDSRFYCNFCNKSYSRSYSLKKHLAKCKVKLKNSELNEIELLKKEMKEIQKKLEQKTAQTINNITNNTTNNFIIMNDYGKEDMSFLKSSQKYTAILNRFIGNGIDGLQKYIKFKYCNPEKPENLTIKYTNKSRNNIHVRNANKWELRDSKDVMDEIYNRDENVEELLNFYENINDLDDNTELDQLQTDFLEKVDIIYDDDNEKELNKLKKTTLNEFYNCYNQNKEKFDT